MDWIVNAIRAGLMPGSNSLAGRIQSDYNAPPAAPAAPRVPEAATETGVRALERQMWPGFFNNGVPTGQDPYPMAEDPMTAGGSHYASVPLPPQRPALGTINPVKTAGGGAVPLPPPRPPQHTAPAGPAMPDSANQRESAWIDPKILSGQNAAALNGSNPQSAWASMSGNSGSGSGVSPPGAGLLSFLGSGAVPAYKQSALTPTDFQGPAPDNPMSGQRVGVVEGSPADALQNSSIFKLLSLFAGGGGFG